MNSLIIALIVLTGALRIWLELRQRVCLLRQRSESPPVWADDAFQIRALGGALRRVNIAILGALAETALALLLAVAGIRAIASSEPLTNLPPVALAVTLSALVLLSTGAVRRAGDAANVFFVDAAIGLGRPSVSTFLADSFMRLIVTSIVTLPLLVAVAFLIEARVPNWWIAAWAIWLTLLTLDLALRPVIQTRLLYSASALQDEALAGRIAQLLKQCGLTLGLVQVLDASRRTRRANASVHGLGREKHIYLHDTLLERLGPDEVLAVVAHEAGHARHRHVLQHLAALAMVGLAAAIGVSVLRDHLPTSTAEQLALIVLLMPSAGFLARPIMLGLSRRFEYEADAFAAAHAGSTDMVRALKELYAANAGVPTSDRVYAAFHASHPAPHQRLGKLEQLSCKAG